MPRIFEAFLNMPLFAVLLGAGTVLSVVLARPVSRRLGEPWIVVFGLGVGLTLVLAATLSPSPGSNSGPCLRSLARPLGPEGMLNWRSGRALNTWMLVPLGVCAGYLGVRRWWILAMAFTVPFFVEAVQRFVPALGRRCQFQDLIDNTWGLILGSFAGIVLGFLAMGVRRLNRR